MYRVLLAEPSEVLATTYTRALVRAGHETEIARDGLECLTQMRTFRPHLLVLEPELLWGGGDGVLALLGEEGTMPPVPVVLLCSKSRQDLKAPQGVVRGQYLKPLAPAHLVHIIGDHLHRTGTVLGNA